MLAVRDPAHLAFGLIVFARGTELADGASVMAVGQAGIAVFVLHALAVADTGQVPGQGHGFAGQDARESLGTDVEINHVLARTHGVQEFQIAVWARQGLHGKFLHLSFPLQGGFKIEVLRMQDPVVGGREQQVEARIPVVDQVNRHRIKGHMRP